MGSTISHTNLYAVGLILGISTEEIYRLLDERLAESKEEIELSIEVEVDDGATDDDDDDAVEVYLGRRGVHFSDIAVIKNLARLLDKKATKRVKLHELFCLLAPMLGKDIKDTLVIAFHCFDYRRRSGTVSKEQLYEVLTLLNSSLFFCGDNKFSVGQLEDLVNSVFASGGMVDGEVRYLEYLETIATHSLLELFLSQRFQGSWKDKVFDEKDADKFFVAIY